MYGVNAQQQPGHRQEGNVIQPELRARKALLVPLDCVGDAVKYRAAMAATPTTVLRVGSLLAAQ